MGHGVSCHSGNWVEEFWGFWKRHERRKGDRYDSSEEMDNRNKRQLWFGFVLFFIVCIVCDLQ